MSEAAALEAQADRAAAAGQLQAARDLLERADQDGEASAGLWGKLSAMRKATGDLPGALGAVDNMLAVAPLDFGGLLSRAMILERLGKPNAAQAYGNALAQAPDDNDLPAGMRPIVQHARDLWHAHQQSIVDRLERALPAELSDFERVQARRFVTNHSKLTRHYHQEPSDFHYPGLPEIEFHDRALFPELDRIESSFEPIKAEFESLMKAERAEIVPYTQYPERVPLRQWKELNNNPAWSAIHLLQNGRLVEQNARHCPATIAALQALPQPVVPGASPNAMFSLLAPRTRIPAHTGVANTRLVCHLPLIVPEKCGFRVGESVRDWSLGEAFVFDDTIEHEAWNDSDELRIVLIFDLWPPALSEPARAAVAAVIGALGVSFSGV